MKSSDPQRRTRREPGRAPAPAATRPAAVAAPFARAFVFLPLVAIAALFWACRGYTPGVAVADDYSFLATLRFERPLDLFDSMGATYYWRPLSRQAWFSAIGPSLLAHPSFAVVANLAALAVTAFALWRIARRAFPAPIAAAIAALPFASEPARALLAWPSGAQHLMAGACAALAVDLALGARWLPAAILALLGMGCHESAGLALLAIPTVAWWRARRATGPRRTARDAGVPAPPLAAVLFPALALALWAAGYVTARAHGVQLPPRPPGIFPIARIPDLLSRALPAALNFEDLAGPAAAALVAGYATLAMVTLFALARREIRVRLAVAFAPLAFGLAWFLLGTLPLTQLLPDWNAWRAWVPTLGLLVGLTAALATLEPRLALAFAGLKLLGVLLATPAPAAVAIEAPATASHMSYLRLVRLQRTLESTRRTLLATYPSLPKRARVCYWNLPRLAEVGFEGNDALDVWYGDSTMTWNRFGGVAGLSRQVDALVEYHDEQSDPAFAIEPRPLRHMFAAAVEMNAQRPLAADTLLILAAQETRDQGPFLGTIAYNRGQIALGRGDLAAADSFLDVMRRYSPRTADFYYLQARAATMRRDWPAAQQALQNCLGADPHHAGGLQLLEVIKEQGVTGFAGPARQP